MKQVKTAVSLTDYMRELSHETQMVVLQIIALCKSVLMFWIDVLSPSSGWLSFRYTLKCLGGGMGSVMVEGCKDWPVG
jgi:hypothetical protein